MRNEQEISKKTLLWKKYSAIMECSYRIVDAVRKQNVFLKARLIDRLTTEITDVIENMPIERQISFNAIVLTLLESVEKQDDILLADYLENILIPFCKEIVEEDICLETESTQKVIINDEMSIELSSSGDYTLLFRDMYFHSNVSPVREASKLAEFWDDPREKVNLVWGLGLGYHIAQILELDAYREIYVFEPEKGIIEIAEKYGVLNNIEKSHRVKIFCDPNGKLCAEYMKKFSDSRLLVYYPSLKTMKEGKLKESLNRYYFSFLASMDQKRTYEMSFRENIKNECLGINELYFQKDTNRAIIVSAGPSLDKNFLQLTNKNLNSVIIASVQTMPKLYKAGIIPDCVVISDIAPELRKKHEGFEKVDCPLVFSSTASVPFIAEHKGPKYIFCQKGFLPAEQLAKEKGWPILDSYGGSVALVSLSLAIEKGFEEIVFLGQDLCYKGNNMHATDTSAPFVSEKVERKKGKDIFGEEVSIPMNLSMYKESIEKVIKEHSDIRFINATEGGLHIEGTTDMRLKDIINADQS